MGIKLNTQKLKQQQIKTEHKMSVYNGMRKLVSYEAPVEESDERGWKLTACGKVIWEKKTKTHLKNATYDDEAPCQVKIEALQMWYDKQMMESEKHQANLQNKLEIIKVKEEEIGVRITDNPDFFNWMIGHEKRNWSCQFKGGYTPFEEAERCEYQSDRTVKQQVSQEIRGLFMSPLG